MRYLSRRVLNGALVVLIVATLVFVLARASGDPVYMLLGDEATESDAELLREQLGLNQPLHLQYADFVWSAVQGDFGTSLRQQRPAMDLVLERVPATVNLALASFLIVLVVGLPLGILAGMKRGTAADAGTMGFAMIGQSVPSFWLGIMLIMVFSVGLGWFPASGRGTLMHLVLPATTLAMYSVAIVARLQRSSILEVMRADYIRTARSKGLPTRQIVSIHVMKNALIPVVTILGLESARLLGGAIIVETVFGYPGVGLLAVQSIVGRDFPVIQAFVICVAAVVVLANLLVDVIYTFLDPRIRFG